MTILPEAATYHDKVQLALNHIQHALSELQVAMRLEPNGRVGEALETGFSGLVRSRDHLLAHLGPFYGPQAPAPTSSAGSDRVLCPVCTEQGLKSSLIDHGTEVHCLGFIPYHDETGVLHSHNPNSHTTRYSCSHGHEFKKIYYLPCPGCGKVKAEQRVVVMKG